MKKINKEFAELMLTKTEGRMIEQLTVSLSAGDRATCFQHAQCVYVYTRVCNNIRTSNHKTPVIHWEQPG